MEAYEASLVEDYVTTILSKVAEDSYPVLANLDREELEAEVMRVSDKYAEKTGEAPEVEDVLVYLEEKYEAKAKKMSAGLQKKLGSVTNSTEAETARPCTGCWFPATAKGRDPKAVTNAMAGERGSPVQSTRISDRDKLSEATTFLRSKGF